MNLEQTKKNINKACMASIISIPITLIFIMYDKDGFNFYNLDWIILVDSLLVIVLTFGLNKKSSFSGILLFLYFVIGKAAIIHETGKLLGVIGIIFFGIYIFKGLKATFTYNRLIKINEKNIPVKSTDWDNFCRTNKIQDESIEKVYTSNSYFYDNSFSKDSKINTNDYFNKDDDINKNLE